MSTTPTYDRNWFLRMPQTPDEHFARANGEARLALIWEKLKEIQKALEALKSQSHGGQT